LTRSSNVLWKEAGSCKVDEEPIPATASGAQLSGRLSCRSLARSARGRNCAGSCRFSLVGGWGGRQPRSLGTSIRHRRPDRRGCVIAGRRNWRLLLSNDADFDRVDAQQGPVELGLRPGRSSSRTRPVLLCLRPFERGVPVHVPAGGGSCRGGTRRRR
jgi:hypothetical protein